MHPRVGEHRRDNVHYFGVWAEIAARQLPNDLLDPLQQPAERLFGRFRVNSNEDLATVLKMVTSTVTAPFLIYRGGDNGIHGLLPASGTGRGQAPRARCAVSVVGS